MNSAWAKTTIARSSNARPAHCTLGVDSSSQYVEDDLRSSQISFLGVETLLVSLLLSRSDRARVSMRARVSLGSTRYQGGFGKSNKRVICSSNL
jgi:hypothetical protein